VYIYHLVLIFVHESPKIKLVISFTPLDSSHKHL